MLTTDLITNQTRILSVARAGRGTKKRDGCPFCVGNEEQTPPEIDRVVDSGGAWQARTVPNLFPLVGGHEVLISSPDHHATLRTLNTSELARVVEMWAQRVQAIDTSSVYPHLFVNDGRGAGASIEHSHSQLVPIPYECLEIDLLAATRSGSGSCPLCALVDDEALVISQAGPFTLAAHPSPRMAGNLIIFPHNHAPLFGAAAQDNTLHMAGILRVALVALSQGDFNLWVAADERSGAAGHWYVELVPRTAIPAGVEMALGICVSTKDAADAADAARARLSELG